VLSGARHSNDVTDSPSHELSVLSGARSLSRLASVVMKSPRWSGISRQHDSDAWTSSETADNTLAGERTGSYAADLD